MLNFRVLIHGPGPSYNLPYNIPTLQTLVLHSLPPPKIWTTSLSKPTHPSPNIVRICKSIRNIGPSQLSCSVSFLFVCCSHIICVKIIFLQSHYSIVYSSPSSKQPCSYDSLDLGWATTICTNPSTGGLKGPKSGLILHVNRATINKIYKENSFL